MEGRGKLSERGYLMAIQKRGKEFCLYPPKIYGGYASGDPRNDEAHDYDLYIKTMQENKVGDRITHTYAAPGIGQVTYKITRMDETGVYAKVVRDSGRILTISDVI
jgi:hypothetical protein